MRKYAKHVKIRKSLIGYTVMLEYASGKWIDKQWFLERKDAVKYAKTL